MRKIKLKDWIKKYSDLSLERVPKDRPTPIWKLRNSIKYIRMRDEYLKQQEILIREGKRRYRLNI